MNSTTRSLRFSPLAGLFLVVALVSVCFCFTPSVAHAQDAAAAVAPASDTAVDTTNSVLSMVSGALAGKFGVVAKIFSILATVSGFCALTLKPFWDKFAYPAITTYVQNTATKADDAWLAAFLSNKAVKFVLWLLNLLAHIKVPIIDKDGAAVSPSSAGTNLPPSP
jgi:hypothetical protein